MLSAVVADVQRLGALGARLVAAGGEGRVVRTLQTNLTEMLLLQILVSRIIYVTRQNNKRVLYLSLQDSSLLVTMSVLVGEVDTLS